MKKIKKLLLAAIAVSVLLLLVACGNAQLDNKITFNADFSGTRTLQMELSAITNSTDQTPEDEPIPYYWLNKHGEDLEKYITDAYKAYFGNDAWAALDTTVTVDDSTLVPDVANPGEFTAGAEYITITIHFDDFADYVTKMRTLAGFNGGLQSKPEDAKPGELAWHYVESSGVDIVQYYTDPTLTYEDGKLMYFEDGLVTKFVYQALWDYMAFTDRYNADTNPDGVFVKEGTDPNPDRSGNYGNKADSDIRDGGIKVRKFDLNICGTEIPYKGTMNSDNYTFDVIDVDLNEVGGFDLEEVAITGNTQYAKDDASLQDMKVNAEFKGTGFDQSKTVWYTAEYSEENGYTVGEQVGTGADYTCTVDTFGTQYLCAVNKGIRSFVEVKAEQYDFMITFVDAENNLLAELPILEGSTAAMPDFSKEGYRYTLSRDSLEGITEDTQITVTYIKTWEVTFVVDGAVVKTVIVDENSGVAEADVPTVTAPEGKEFDKWDKAFDKVTSDLTVTALFKDTAENNGGDNTTEEPSGCSGSVIGVSGAVAGACVLALGAAVYLIGNKRKQK